MTETPASGAGEILHRAAHIVDGARNAVHGDKERSFEAIGGLWTAYLSARRVPSSKVTAADVGAMMVLLKFARSNHGKHVEDHGVDAAGYAAIWAELRAAEATPVAATPETSLSEGTVVVVPAEMVPAPVVPAIDPAKYFTTPPANYPACRKRLQAEGKTYPKSGCVVCGGIFFKCKDSEFA